MNGSRGAAQLGFMARTEASMQGRLAFPVCCLPPALLQALHSAHGPLPQPASGAWSPLQPALAHAPPTLPLAPQTLQLEEVRHEQIGDAETRGISGGQRKRVNVGLELVANPSLLFLDEPTVGGLALPLKATVR